jgi:hypothetical protein
MFPTGSVDDCVADSDGERVDRGAAAEQVSAVQTASNESVETDNRMIRANSRNLLRRSAAINTLAVRVGNADEHVAGLRTAKVTDPVGNISLRRTETGRRFFRLARAGESTQSGSREMKSTRPTFPLAGNAISR